MANLNRRRFLKSTGVLTLGISFAPGKLISAVEPNPEFAPNAFVRIEHDGTVRVVMPHAEMGQGAYTGLAQVLADELDADWLHVVAEHLTSLAEDYKHPDWGVIATGASTSVSGQWNQFRQAGASARAMLIEAAAQQWGVAPSSLTTENSMVIDATSGRKISYGELTAAAARITPPSEVKLKSPDQFKIIGQNLQRVDSVTKSNGQATFGMDLQLPDMLYASIARCPIFGGKLGRYDAAVAEKMPGVHRVVEIPGAVAVIADSFWQAKKAKDAVEIEWDEGGFGSTSSEDLWREYAETADKQGPVFEKHGTLDLEEADSMISGEMRFPYLAHAPMEPLNATAQVKGDRLEIWAGTQFQGIDAGFIEAALGYTRDKITINTLWLGGSFGRRGPPNSDFVVEAAQIAKASGLPNPIKMIWQREDDIRAGWYRPMALHRFQIGVDKEGLPAHWEHRLVAGPIAKGTSFEPAYSDENGFDLLSIEGLKHQNYHCPNLEFSLHDLSHPVTVCWLRGEAELHTSPVVETILNRLARHASADRIDYRRRLLKDTDYGKRMRGVLDLLETASNWHSELPANVYRGVAVQPCFGSVCGYVVELKEQDKRLSFHKVTAAIDCGRVINPDSVRSQIQGCAVFALSMVMGQQVTIERGRAVQSNFHDYSVAYMHHAPQVDVHIVNSGLDHPTGVGEVGVPSFIPAVMDAITTATGQDINEFPMQLGEYSFLDA